MAKPVATSAALDPPPFGLRIGQLASDTVLSAKLFSDGSPLIRDPLCGGGMSKLLGILGMLAVVSGCDALGTPVRKNVADAILINPSRMPDLCPLEWTVKPNFMRAGDDSARLLGMISGFWFGDLSTFGSKMPSSAISNIYSLKGGDPEHSVLTIVAFYFPDDESRKFALQLLDAELASSRRHRYLEYPPYLVTIGLMDPGLGDCLDWFWSEVSAKLRAAA